MRRLSIELRARVAQAVTGEEALAMLVPADGGAAPFDVAFLDEHGVDGGLRGTDVTRLAREHERRRVGAEAVARRLVSGDDGRRLRPGHDALARESGQDIVLRKPMPERLPAELLALLG